MSYCDTPEEFDLNLFMQAMGYDRGYLGKDFMEAHGITGEDICLWSDHELTFIRREEHNTYHGGGDFMVITMTEYDDAHARHEVTSGRAWAVEGRKYGDKPGTRQLIELGYRLPWPTTFNEAYDSFRKLGWFGKMPNARAQLMQTYEWLAAGIVVSTGYGTLRPAR
jgi:hypothetical protein